MSARPTWFGDPYRPLFGWLHVPAKMQARGGIVLCPTLCVEAMCAYPAYRQIAEELELAGFVVLRFDYAGTGDSSGDLADMPSQLMFSVDEALRFVRRCGLERVGLVGLRIGATLAAAAAARDGSIDAIALWDPIEGSSFLREQKILKSMSIGETPELDDPDAEELLGLVLNRETAEILAQLDFTSIADRPAREFVVLEREERALRPRIASHLKKMGATFGKALGQGAFIDVTPDLSRLPTKTMQDLVDWLDSAFDDRTSPVQPVITSTYVNGAWATTGFSEHPLTIDPLGLFGVLIEPKTPLPAPTVIFLNAGLLHHIGPARLWVDLSRQWAKAGIRSLRFDLSGLGDSPNRTDQRRQVSYPPFALEDIANAARAVSPNDPRDVVFAGLCAGAYHSIEAGLNLLPKGVMAINPILSFEPPELIETGSLDRNRLAVQPYNRIFRYLRRSKRMRWIGERMIPPAAWWFLDRTGMQPSPARRPVRAFRQ